MHFNDYLYNPLGAIPRFNSFYGIASGPVWFGSIYCTGIESKILNCAHGSIGSLCRSKDHSGVECPGMPLSCYFQKPVSIYVYLHYCDFVAVFAMNVFLFFVSDSSCG